MEHSEFGERRGIEILCKIWYNISISTYGGGSQSQSMSRKALISLAEMPVTTKA
ncbi:MAG: hypothetical protein FWC79_06720 [Oscillospiraceae bacterium]|nr:hypothetical protein [Oscillospiraceae bacterium]